ncbi:tail tube protein [Synechococcus phage MA10]|uniref:Tail tube protein n=1 Tax=Synechococcus phage S-H34 TaxID=2718942 RepID=A0A6G8R6W7_9CAUD|nr:tail tube [Synechococcus phage S-H34]QIN96898.1 tail tube protein [Synechococcus phage S-H34]
MSQRSIEDFKAVLQGGGVRPTMFEVELTFPESVVSDSTEITRDGTFLIQAAALPASNVGTIEVPFRGRKLKVSGDRTFDPWNVTVMNDVSFGLRVAFEKWAEKIQNHNYALGATALNDYFASAIVRQLDRDGTQLRAYSFEGIWPSAVAEIGVDFNATDDVERYDVTFNVQYWSAAKDGDPYTSAVPRDTSGQINDIIS